MRATLIVPLALALVGRTFAQWANGQAAELVIGQADFASSALGTTSQNMNIPQGIAIDIIHGKLYFADSGNNRILRFSYPLTCNGSSAELVIGQSDFISSGAGISSSKLSAPTCLSVHNGDLWVSDFLNNRVLCFRAAYLYSSNLPSAGLVLGQTTFLTNSSGTSSHEMSGPNGIAVDESGNLWVAEYGNNRVILFKNVDLADNGADADLVLGQPGFSTSSTATSQSGMKNPGGLCARADILFVCDALNHRVLRFDNPISKTNGALADGVLGQSDFVSGAPNQGPSPTPKATAKTTMILESNQSSSCPLSNMIWSAATQITSIASPQESMGAEERRIYGGSFRKVMIMKTEIKPTGKLIKKIQRHE